MPGGENKAPRLRLGEAIAQQGSSNQSSENEAAIVWCFKMLMADKACSKSKECDSIFIEKNDLKIVSYREKSHN